MKTKNLFFTFALFLLFSSCVKQTLNLPAARENNLNLNSLATLAIGENELFTQDYILDFEAVDSISAAGIEAVLSDDKSKITLHVNNETARFFSLNVWVDGTPYTIPCRRSDKVDYTFTFDPQGSKYKRVQLTGQMNDWAPNLTPDLELNDAGLYEVNLQLSPGNYLYQMSLDGDWNHDPNNPDKVDNGYGKFNSILQVAGNTDKFPVLTTGTLSGNNITLSVENTSDNIFAYWQNYELPSHFIKQKSGKIEISIPGEAVKAERSFIRVWASNEYGVSNDILVPLHHGKVLTKTSQLNRHDRHAQIMYFLLVDRFKNGNKENDRPMNRPDVHPKVDYWGGDLAGVQQAIEAGYFDKLGVNTLWISPLNQNPDEPFGFYEPANTKFSPYHGYWPISFSQVDHRFGSNEELKEMVNVAHDSEINVLLDYVAHHVHELNPLYQDHPEYFTSLYLPDGTLNTERWNDHRLTTWFDTFIPTIDFANPEMLELMTDSALYWLNEFNLDGFRHDACKHVDLPFWRMLTRKIKENNEGKNLYQIGETYGSPELIASYLNTGMLDGQFDFNVFEDANTSFAGVGEPDLVRLKNVLEGSLRTYGTHNLMGYISGNHDKPRFMALASGDLDFGEDSKAAGWEREIGITDSIAYDKMALMQSFVLTIPGVPVIFYGDEIGLTGANDPDCRRMMKFDNLNKREEKLLNITAKLGQLRKNNPVFMYGDFFNLQAENNSWVYARKYFSSNAIVVLNNSDKEKEFNITLPANLQKTNYSATFEQSYQIKNNRLSITLPPYSSEVLLSR